MTVRTRPDGDLSVQVVAPSGATTEIVLDQGGRVLGVRNVKAPRM